MYRFGFNGQEKDDEITGVTGSHLNFKYRMYDSRIGRFFAVDPLTNKYPMLTPYQFASLSPIWMLELEGLEGVTSTGGRTELKANEGDDGRFITSDEYNRAEQYNAGTLVGDWAPIQDALYVRRSGEDHPYGETDFYMVKPRSQTNGNVGQNQPQNPNINIGGNPQINPGGQIPQPNPQRFNVNGNFVPISAATTPAQNSQFTNQNAVNAQLVNVANQFTAGQNNNVIITISTPIPANNWNTNTSNGATVGQNMMNRGNAIRNVLTANGVPASAFANPNWLQVNWGQPAGAVPVTVTTR